MEEKFWNVSIANQFVGGIWAPSIEEAWRRLEDRLRYLVVGYRAVPGWTILNRWTLRRLSSPIERELGGAFVLRVAIYSDTDGTVILNHDEYQERLYELIYDGGADIASLFEGNKKGEEK